MSLKQSILQILEENRETSISGQQLAKRFSVSRAAVWKAINALKTEGYQIDSVTNKGYRLAEDCDILSAEGILPFLKLEYKDTDLYVSKTVESTNQEAKKYSAKKTKQRILIVANEQTLGKGRFGRTFFSPENSGIYMSIILPLNIEAINAVLITTAAAVAVCRAIQSVANVQPQIKWVNDIFLEGKKICGILTEAFTNVESGIVESVVVGIGVNFKTKPEQFPDEIKETAASLFSGKAPSVTRNHLIAEMTNQLLEICGDLNDRQFLEEYKARSMVLGEKIQFFRNNSWHIAKVLDIDPNGGLIIEDEQGKIQTLNSGEISIQWIKTEEKER
ncbi:biotin/acetyl-CoA-carboxylase ligase [Syntrophobotulus glycolicus DSM 8271]|uniref:Bifunctional ligase/repressor BirA n=1 Tax=Syntrophobotulus glycolicus (strain DSM 8271 / FlGlyR) TaxID=645991 RepID=F0T1A1_SYNGF|nr:biotin--[acetyl-CoA-carboxylase] ligase [Syntrophobotulus glycolicus]ADY55165.1 biotin/acetyl-CoA-carboxylase ligase [Syntrophobotulus glycolicus DSM 8271]